MRAIYRRLVVTLGPAAATKRSMATRGWLSRRHGPEQLHPGDI